MLKKMSTDIEAGGLTLGVDGEVIEGSLVGVGGGEGTGRQMDMMRRAKNKHSPTKRANNSNIQSNAGHLMTSCANNSSSQSNDKHSATRCANNSSAANQTMSTCR